MNGRQGRALFPSGRRYTWILVAALLLAVCSCQGAHGFAHGAAAFSTAGAQARRRRQRQRQRQQQSSVTPTVGRLAATADPPHNNNNDATATTSTTTQDDETAAASAWQEHRGDARGAVLRLTDVSVWRGPAEILKGIDWSVAPGTKWALVGANGAGKSTLLQAIANDDAERTGRTSGRIVISTTAELAYLQQTAIAGSTRTVYQEAAAGMVALAEAEARMQAAAAKGDLVALEAATTRFQAVGGYQQESKVARVLKGLGFTDLDQKCSELSGGWQMRVALAKTLLTEATLTLLDEPSNHLDASAKAWVARYLANYDGDGALILVTHDVDLLKSMDHMAEVIPGASGLQIYKSCSYTQYMELKTARTAAAYTAYETNQAKAAKLQAFVDRFGASANKASAAQSRVKQIEKMRAAGELDAPADALVTQRFKPSLRLPDPPKAMGDSLLRLRGAAVGHAGNVLVPRVDLDIQRGMKVLIRGPNGAGKSTILHSLRGGIPLLEGQRLENESLKLAFFTQDLAQELDPNQRAMDIVTAYARAEGGDISISNEAARSALGRLGLTGEKALRKIRDLSGGEKARVALAMFSLKPSNLYLLDEASNHLDLECSEALSESLSDWGGETGSLVVVSHDRNFCQRISFTHVATVKDGSLVLEERSARESDWSSAALSTQIDVGSSDEEGSSLPTANDTEEMDPAVRKKLYNAPKRIEKLESLIEGLEAKVAGLDDEMMTVGNDVGKLVDLQEAKEKLEASIAEYMDEWEDLEDLP